MTGAEFTLDWRKPGWGRAARPRPHPYRSRRALYSDRDIPTAPRMRPPAAADQGLPGRWQASLGYTITASTTG